METMIMTDSGYYIPTIDQFVAGFNFETLERISLSFAIWDFSNKEVSDEQKYEEDVWIPRICDWKYNKTELIEIPYNEFTWYIMGKTLNDYSSFNDEKIEKLIKEGKIRVKIKSPAE